MYATPRQQAGSAFSPQRGAYRVNAVHQRDHVRLRKATREVARSRRVRDHLRVQGIHVRLVVAQTLDVLQTRATAHHVVAKVQHVIRLVIRQMHLQQLQRAVDLLDQSQPGHQSMHRRNATTAHRFRMRADLVMHITAAKHRLGLRTKSTRKLMPSTYPTPTFFTVPAAFFYRYSFHRKGPFRWSSNFPPDTANSL